MKKKAIAVSVALAIGSVAAEAQRSGPTWNDFRFRVFAPIEGRLVTRMPYSAEFESESIQTLGDGNRIVIRATGRVYRDSEGRVRREEDRPSGTPTISITDPVARTTVTLDPATRTAREGAFVALQLYALSGALSAVRAGNRVSLNGWPLIAVGGRGGPGESQTDERLADRQIEGVIATGLRRTTTIAAGAIGNERPITVVSEEWTSPELQVLVLTDVNDPRTGRSTYKLLKINRLDPDPALFQVPADFTVQRLGGQRTAAPAGAGGRGTPRGGARGQ
jgi:hypothetical protein